MTQERIYVLDNARFDGLYQRDAAIRGYMKKCLADRSQAGLIAFMPSYHNTFMMMSTPYEEGMTEQGVMAEINRGLRLLGSDLQFSNIEDWYAFLYEEFEKAVEPFKGRGYFIEKD